MEPDQIPLRSRLSAPPFLLSYFTSRDEAAAALRELGQRGFDRGVVVERSTTNAPRLTAVFWRRSLLWAVAGALLGLAAVQLLLRSTALPGELSVVGLLAGAIPGRLLGWWLHRSRFKRLVEAHSEWLAPDEALLLLQADRAQLSRAIPRLQDIGDPHPAVFLLPMTTDAEPELTWLRGGPLTAAEMAAHAEQLADSHQLRLSNAKGQPLLDELRSHKHAVLEVRRDLAAAQRAEQALYPGGEWILDNAYLVEGHIAEVQRGLSKSFYHELPQVAHERFGRETEIEPRVYRLAKELVRHSEALIGEPEINAFLEAFQTRSQLSTGELWAMPLMLRLVLTASISRRAIEVRRRMLEAELAEFWAYRLQVVARGDPDQLYLAMAELTRSIPAPSANFGFYLLGHLHDAELALMEVQGWLQRTLDRGLAELTQNEQTRQAALQLYLSNAITSLRNLSRLDWREVFERQSVIEQVMRRDPDGVYGQMDFQTRDRYRSAMEELAKAWKIPELEIAEEVLRLALEAAGDSVPQSAVRHVGYYLIDQGRDMLLSRFGVREIPRLRALGWARKHHLPVYLGGLLVVSLLPLVGVLWVGRQSELNGLGLALLGLASALPASQLALQLINFAITRLVPPWTLPKMAFAKRGLGEAHRTLVVVPMVIDGRRTIDEEIEKLEIRYLAYNDPNLLFSLFGDFADSVEPRLEHDQELLDYAIERITALNQRHQTRGFCLFVRQREWADTEQLHIGWERKRGKLEDLNRLIAGAPPRTDDNFVKVGNARELQKVHYVITLDSDTMLASDSARRMVETMAHPLNRPLVGPDGRVQRGYGIIQPRVSTSLPSATASLFARLFNDPVGSDPYTTAVSDVYQDLAGEASYHGKGIYDPRVFHEILSNRFPEGRILSHDLLEGAHVRTGLATDIELFEDFPADYRTYARREHRWIRGDWQIADWCLPWVPGPNGKRMPNPISALNRWKVFDNLRRSLVPIGMLAYLLASWALAPTLAAIAGGAVAFLLFFQPFLRLTTWAGRIPAQRRLSRLDLTNSLARSVVEGALLPHQALLVLDAIGRVAYRRWISKRNLLEWTTAQMAAWQHGGSWLGYWLNAAAGSALAAAAAWLIRSRLQENWAPALPFLLAWLISPLVIWRLNRRPRRRRPRERLAPSDLLLLRRIARKTWRYFDEFVSADTHWLPPDNYQVSHQDLLASRTSPTNMGLWMLSALAAHDFGYLTLDQLLDRLSGTMDTLTGLERFRGHFFNWYQLDPLEPLEPRYVSTVDSGNLVACLWTLAAGLRELRRRPLLGPWTLNGLRDSYNALVDSLELYQVGSEVTIAIERIGSTLAEADQTHRLPERLGQLRQPIARLADRLGAESGSPAVWSAALQRELDAWLEHQARYRVEEVPRSPETGAASWPSLTDLVGVDERNGDQGLAERASMALKRIEKLVATAERLAGAVEFDFLYDPVRRIFTIGFNVSEMRRDNSYYDLLASEARLASYVAIAGGQVPPEHWLALGRPYSAVNGRRVLSSWGGTMFEYLMPWIFQRDFDNSLLQSAMHDAVQVQIRYGQRRGVPWGISESAYADLDTNRTYQYRAFGVPGLGLKHGLDQDMVVAPYASLLALEVSPERTLTNLKHLEVYGLESEYGFFEAIDFSRQRTPEGERGVLVRAYMAHHQAMGLLALENFLQDGVVRRRFHADPKIRAAEPLLYERIPVSVPLDRVPTARIETELAPVQAVRRSVSRFDTPHTRSPTAQLLSNGRYTVVLTGAGGGFSRWQDIELTRWRADATADGWGTFIYLQDRDGGQRWSSAYHPVGGEYEDYLTHLALDRVEYRRVEHGIESQTSVIVSPDDDVEIRRIALFNRSGRTRRLMLTSYAELALAPHLADQGHPAFNKLFVETEADPTRQMLFAHRRSRSPEDPPVHFGQRLIADQPAETGWEFETDRMAFIGRGRTLADPRALEAPLGNRAGFVLDPIFSTRAQVELEAGERTHLTLLLAAGESQQRVGELLEKYSESMVVERALNLAWTRAQLELRMLRIQPDDARRMQKLASYLLYPSRRFRPAPERLAANVKGQVGLWPYGISGDYPILLVSVSELREANFVRELLQAHNYLRRHGLMADLVILNEEATSYDGALSEQLTRLVQAHSTYTGVDQPGGVYLLMADQLPEDDRRLLGAAARVAFNAARGSLAQQLAGTLPEEEFPEPIELGGPGEREPVAALEPLDLAQSNPLGGFSEDGSEYVIELDGEHNTPQPWSNVIANPEFGTLLTESGSGFTWYRNSQRFRLTGWSNDPVLDPPSEAFYLRDLHSGEVWSPTPQPIREPAPYRIRHGAGYSLTEHHSHGIDQELLTFVPMDDQGGRPLRIQRLRLRNVSNRDRKLSLIWYAEWVLGEHREDTQMHVVTGWDGDTGVLTARNPYHPDGDQLTAFMALDPPAEQFTADRAEFIGRNRSLRQPAALERKGLAGQVGAGLDPCGALQLELELPPGEQVELLGLLGVAEGAQQAQELVNRYREHSLIEQSLAETRAWWDRSLGTLQITTPEPSLNVLVNRWLNYQTLSCRIWGRSGFHQSGGAYGFRDQLQDMLAVVYAQPRLTREHLLRAAGRQFVEGDVQHWWHPPSGIGVRTRISDDLLWLPYAVSCYVQVTGDQAILQEPVGFLEARELEDDEQEAFVEARDSDQRASLYEHCRRAIERADRFGEHGLPLMGAGDWNDGMNRVGAEGRGESVWLAWFFAEVLIRFAELSERHGRAELAEQYRTRSRAIVEAIDRHAWDGDWYLRAFHDDGNLIGSHHNAEAQIDSLPQSWAVIAGGGDPDRARQALHSAWERLVLEDPGLSLLFDPPFDGAGPDPGYIAGYPPGVRENGGQYTHAAIWQAIAWFRLGDGDRALQLLQLLNPIRHSVATARYQVEPYVVAADIYNLEGQVGRGGWTWYTGSAGWMYRAVVEELLGMKVRGSVLEFDPVLPRGWKQVGVRYRHGEAIYSIELLNPEGAGAGVSSVELDGRRLPGARIPLERGTETHRVRVVLGERPD